MGRRIKNHPKWRWKDSKQDIQGIKQDIGDSKQDIQNCYDTNKKMHFEFKYKRR
jgi:hypothetical protein